MVRNAWKEVDNTDDDEEFEDTIWYYFQSSGKAYKNTKKTINGQTYIFNEDGKMLFGWINAKDTSSGQYEMADMDEDDSTEWKGAAYYAGEANDGAVATSAWRQIRVHDEQPALKDNTNYDHDDDYDYWFYFDSNSKKVGLSDDETALKEKKINGKYYGFAYDGHMVSEWVNESSVANVEADEKGVKYFSDPEVGARVTKGWFKVVPSYALDADDWEGGDDESHWFYATNNGELAHGEIRSINGKKYLFDLNGEMKAGLRWLELDDDGKTLLTDGDGNAIIGNDLTRDEGTETELDTYTEVDRDSDYVVDEKDFMGLYYFAKPSDTDATMKTGTCKLTIDGETYSFRFISEGAHKGAGFNGFKDNAFYINGRKLTADSDNKFEIYECELTDDEKKVYELHGESMTANELVYDNDKQKTTYDGWAVVSSSGTIVKSGTKKDGDDYKITVSGYLITKIRDSNDSEWNVTTWDTNDGE